MSAANDTIELRGLPAHEANGAGASGGYDAAADAAELLAAPKENAQPLPEPAAEAHGPGGEEKGTTEATGGQPAGGPAADDPKPPPTSAAGADPNDQHKAAAKEYIEAYDTTQAMGFAWWGEQEGGEKFLLKPFPKERATHHLSRGLAAGKVPEMPWWMGLAIALVPSAMANFMLAVEMRKQRKAEENRANAGKGHPLAPDSITDRDGNPVAPPPPSPPPTPTAAPPPSPTPTPTNPVRDVPVFVPRERKPRIYAGPPCEVCGKPTLGANPDRRLRKYCSRSCAGHGMHANLDKGRPQ